MKTSRLTDRFAVPGTYRFRSIVLPGRAGAGEEGLRWEIRRLGLFVKTAAIAFVLGLVLLFARACGVSGF